MHQLPQSPEQRQWAQKRWRPADHRCSKPNVEKTAPPLSLNSSAQGAQQSPTSSPVPPGNWSSPSGFPPSNKVKHIFFLKSIFLKISTAYIISSFQMKTQMIYRKTTCKNSHGSVSPYAPPAGGSDERGQNHSLCSLVWRVSARALLHHMQWAESMSAWLRCCTELTLRLPADGCLMFGNWLQQCPKNRVNKNTLR